ncbi:MepB family protein (plasmid) [Photobacterium damselae]|uniref:MepB family protein n=1 Tax=Photobacterium damselae TaxID=38293 RepID=UPI0025437408
MHTEYNWFENPDLGETPASFLELIEKVLIPLNPEGTTNVEREPESGEYGAVMFKFNGMKCLFRQAKTTPKKVGQFVTIWKREAEESEIAPFNTLDGIELVFIASFDPSNKGFFVFQNELLGKKNVFTHNGREGKRAIRVYAPWIKPTVKQAISTQKWQISAFINLNLGAEVTLSKAKQLIRNSGNLSLF